MPGAPMSFVHGFFFSLPAGEVAAFAPEEVLPALAEVERRVAQGLHAAGFISYEAASGFTPHLTTRSLHGFPLLRFDLYHEKIAAPFVSQPGEFGTSSWSTTLTEPEYLEAVEEIRELIAAGDCYQVNLTMARRFRFSGALAPFFAQLIRSQPTPYAASLEAGRFRILSASPELFFSLKDGVITTRPMKGTASRGRWFEEDRQASLGLKASAKERAENLMIVDLLRNDLGIVSKTGSVTVPKLFEIETLPTVHQMTSTITSRLRPGAGLADILRALFPCGSITGAPKRKSMEIISRLEKHPRGLYTGCIGYVSPESAQFSVAIRTVVIDMATGEGILGVGSGITHDSKATSEYAESLAKGRFAQEKPREFHLIESLLYDESGYFLRERHLRRLERSASYFSFAYPEKEVRATLETAADRLNGIHKVRLTLHRDGSLQCESAPLAASKEVNLALARSVTDPADRFLYHKTSLRETYEKEAATRTDCQEVLFANHLGEITEGSYSNVVLRLDGKLVTPALGCGLLPGVFREELLERGEIEERILTLDDLRAAEELYVINSVRKWRRARLLESVPE